MTARSCRNCGNCDGWFDEGYGIGEFICIIDQDGKDHPELECDKNGDCPKWRPMTSADLKRAEERCGDGWGVEELTCRTCPHARAVPYPTKGGVIYICTLGGCNVGIPETEEWE